MSGLSINDPVTLTLALSSQSVSRIIPGDTLLLRAGTYTGEYISLLVGSQANPIIIRPYAGERVIIDGYINIQGADLTCIEIEFMNSRTDRTRATDDGLDGAARSVAANTKLINCVIHDAPVNGVCVWELATNALVYGCLIYNNGYINTYDDAGDGHGIYTQNISGVKTYKHNLISKNFSYLFQSFARTDTPQKGFDFLSNICIGGVVFFGGQGGDNAIRYEDIKVAGNHIIGVVQFGYGHTQNGDVEFTNNRLHGTALPDTGFSTMPLYFQWFETINSQHNIVSTTGDWLLRYMEPTDTQYDNQVIDNNAYHGSNPTDGMFNEDGVDNYTLAQWQTRGFDANSTHVAGMPTANFIEVFNNEYKDALSQREGSLVIWNWENLEAVSVDLTALGLTVDATYRWRQAQDPYVDTGTFVYAGDPVSFSMLSHTVAEPIGYGSALTTTSFPLFGAFVIEKA